MTHTEELLKSFDSIKEIHSDYYKELIELYSNFSEFNNYSLENYVKKIFSSNKRNFFTICSKENFNNLESDRNWINSIIYTPLNDHSRAYLKKGDIVFCYRQGQFSDLEEALLNRGIYALGFVASEPKELYKTQEGHNRYGVAIIFPFGLKNHLELRNIQLNPITISLTPYNGNRNDALQYIPDDIYSKTLLELICRKNSYLRNQLEIVLDIEIKDIPLPEEVWRENYNKSTDSSPHTPEQIIYYGVPGCGKSFKVEEKINKEITNKADQENQVMRVVFHPDYTNADFVGQIMPLVDDSIEYRFKAGPFSRILKHAYKEPNKKFILVIEEINRGNAAAIFGDLFQLLDRDKNGFSSYSVTNTDITSFVMSIDDYHNDKNIPDSVNVGDTIWTLNTGIRLPPNLSILATMNTSDQNVFTLDNAFQRRWEMKYISNKISEEELKKEENKNLKIQYNTKIGKTTISWGTFRNAINKKIASSEFSFSNAEDKQLGLFFIQPKKRDVQSNDAQTTDGKANDSQSSDAQTNSAELTISNSDFSNKVLKYLWLDVFKRDREEIFNPDIHTFGDLVEKFKESKAFENCFNDEFLSELKIEENS